MPYRLTKIYTRQGDKGFTNLGKNAVPKDDLLIDAMGNVDELNAHIGFVLSLCPTLSEIQACLQQVQNDLFDLGGELFMPEQPAITNEHVARLEQTLDTWNADLPPLEEFLLPHGNPANAACHVVRTVCRRTERSLVKLNRQTPLKNETILKYINRLSDLLFVACRQIGKQSADQELLWQR